jgi:hypothetical protein
MSERSDSNFKKLKDQVEEIKKFLSGISANTIQLKSNLEYRFNQFVFKRSTSEKIIDDEVNQLIKYNKNKIESLRTEILLKFEEFKNHGQSEKSEKNKPPKEGINKLSSLISKKVIKDEDEEEYFNINKPITVIQQNNIENKRQANNIEINNNNNNNFSASPKKIEDIFQKNTNLFDKYLSSPPSTNPQSHSQKSNTLFIIKRRRDPAINKEDFRSPKALEEFKSNRPKNPIYSSNKAVLCAFCNISSNDKESQKKLGPMYGPFIHKGKFYFIHETCGMFSPKIYIDGEGQLENVIYDVKIAKYNTCTECKKRGASIKCENKQCNKKYHFLCGKKADCAFDNQSFTMHCTDHIEKERVYLTDLNSDIQCSVCNSGMDEDVLLICSKCDNSFHTYCHNPKVKSIPKDDWYCFKCTNKIKFEI